jgi:hypothetical protein
MCSFAARGLMFLNATAIWITEMTRQSPSVFAP